MAQRKTLEDYVNGLKGDEFKDLNKAKALKLTKIVVAEIFGTAIFVGLGCGSLIFFSEGKEQKDDGIGVKDLKVVLTFAFAVTTAISIFGHISGAFINPSLALTAVFIGKLSLPMFLVYTISECIGATLGVAVIKGISPYNCTGGSFCVTTPNPILNTNEAVFAEAVMTFCLCMVLCSALDYRNHDKVDSLAIKFGCTVVALALFGAQYTGCSLNPARSFGPALFSGVWTSHWVYWVGPFVGAAAAGLFYQLLFSEEKPTPTKSESNGLETIQAS